MPLPSKYISKEEAIIKARTFCNYRERCHKELKDKLYSFGLWAQDVEYVIGQMMEENMLNEERYARSYVRGHFYQKRWGKYKIQVELRQKGIYDNLISLAMSEIEEDDYEKTILHLIEVKKRSISGTKNEIKNKISRYLMQKGYQYQDFGKHLTQ